MGWRATRPAMVVGSARCDWPALLHVVVPLLAVIGWIAFGPHARTDRRAVSVAMCWPLAWLVWTMLIGVTTKWFPYPFLDVYAESWAAVGATCIAVLALFAVLFTLLWFLDRRLVAVNARNA